MAIFLFIIQSFDCVAMKITYARMTCLHSKKKTKSHVRRIPALEALPKDKVSTFK
jgi:hypothetical protein